MNDNETNKFPTENDPLTSEEREEQMADEQSEPLSPEVTDEEEPQEGFAFDMTSLVIGVAFCFFMFGESLSSGNWTFLLYLFAVVIIHEMGHVTAGKIFGCAIQEMQVFFFPFLTYKPRRDDESGSWRSIKWSLGALPLGGLCRRWGGLWFPIKAGVAVYRGQTGMATPAHLRGRRALQWSHISHPICSPAAHDGG